jgi:hypothetical protein
MNKVLLAVILMTFSGGAVAQETAVPVEVDGIELSVVKAQMVNLPEPKEFGSPQTTAMILDGYLLVTLELKNKNEAVINFVDTQWDINLTDETGSKYYRIHAMAPGEIFQQNRIIYPDKPLQINFAFVKPISESKNFSLSLPAQSINSGKMKPPKSSPILVPFTGSIITTRTEAPAAVPGDDAVTLQMGTPLTEGPLNFEVTGAVLGSIGYNSSYGIDKAKTDIPVFTVAYQWTNVSDTKKLNAEELTTQMDIVLTDEFDNTYKAYGMAPADEASGKLTSLYPGATYKGEIHFEPPIKKAQRLNMTVDAEPLGFKKKIKVEIPAEKIKAELKD